MPSSFPDLQFSFVRGLNVFGRNVITMAELQQKCEAAFRRLDDRIRFLDSYGSTGNIAILAPAVDLVAIRKAIQGALGKPCAVISADFVREVREAFEGWPVPPRQAGFRWTPGFALLCEETASPRPLSDPEVGSFRPLRESLVIVHRRDREVPKGSLDRNNRGGGWAAVTDLLESQAGGVWTSRSFNDARQLHLYATLKLTRLGSNPRKEKGAT